MAYDRAHWEQLWARTPREHPDKVAQRPPNAHLIAFVASLRPGRSLDAGCGHGAETLWLAAHGWEVTAVDFSASALAHARSTAEASGPDIAGRIAWVEGDLAVWTPPRDRFDLVVCLYAQSAPEKREEVCVELVLVRHGQAVRRAGVHLEHSTPHELGRQQR
jgi:2-polyprenyl-3-methyl-5-hydroxy-6-metoxy-1,4-benzoquinol methylase